MNFASISFALALGLSALAGCGQASREVSEPSRNVSAKKVAPKDVATQVGDNTYRIAVADMTITAPEGWYVADTGMMSKLMDAGKDASTATMDASLKAAVEGAMKRTTSLFSFMEVPPGSPREYIPALIGVSEDVSMLPGVVRGRDYFFHARRVMEQAAVPTVIATDYVERTIGGKSFDRMDVEMGAPGQTVNQRYFAARHGGVVVAFIQSYRTEEELAVLDRALDSIKLDW